MKSKREKHSEAIKEKAALEALQVK